MSNSVRRAARADAHDISTQHVKLASVDVIRVHLGKLSGHDSRLIERIRRTGQTVPES